MAKKDHSTKFYCYAHRTADTGHIFYIGKGHGDRAYSKQRSRYWHNKANKHGYTIEIIATGLTEHQAFDIEREFIAFYGRDKLVNLTDGGEGQSGFKKPIDVIEKTAKAHRGMKRSEEARKNMSIAQKNSKNRKDISGEKNPAKRHDVREKMSKADRSYMIGENNPMKKPEIIEKFKGKNNPAARCVVCIDTNNIFETAKEASLWLSIEISRDIKRVSITQCCRGVNKTAGGYRWKYADK